MQEPCAAEDEGCTGPITIRRDPALADNRLLPPKFSEVTGSNIYRGLLEGFRVSAASQQVQTSRFCQTKVSTGVDQASISRPDNWKHGMMLTLLTV